MKSLMVEKPEDWSSTLRDLCAECGVKLVYTPALPKAPINGATRWIASKYPCIQMSSQEKRYDTFWFSFFHEVGHIILHGKKDFFLENVDYDNKETEKENEADCFAANILLSSAQEAEIIANNDFSSEAILKYSRQFNTHPSIILGRLQHKRLIPKKKDMNIGFIDTTAGL